MIPERCRKPRSVQAKDADPHTSWKLREGKKIDGGIGFRLHRFVKDERDRSFRWI